jgi:hypothetical protein
VRRRGSRGLGLDPHETDEVVDGVDGLGGVLDLPDDDGRDLHRVAVGVVDLERRRLVVAYPGGDLAPQGERVDPAQAGGADRPAVPAEQGQDAGLAGGDGRQAEQGEHPGQQQAHVPPGVDAVQHHRDDDRRHGEGERGPARDVARVSFADGCLRHAERYVPIRA